MQKSWCKILQLVPNLIVVMGSSKSQVLDLNIENVNLYLFKDPFSLIPVIFNEL